MLGVEKHQTEDSHQGNDDCNQRKYADKCGQSALLPVLGPKLLVEEINIIQLVINIRHHLFHGRKHELDDRLDISARRSPYINLMESVTPSVFTEHVEGEITTTILQRPEIKVLTDTGSHSPVLMSRRRSDEIHVKVFLRLLVEDHHSTFRHLIGFHEIPAVHYIYPHEFQEIVRHRVTLEINSLSLIFSSPAHS